MDSGIKVEMGFVQRRLPWIVGGAMLVLYIVTLSRWPTPSGVMWLSQVLGWEWRPSLGAPLHVLLTLPVKWLPEGLQLIALNLIEAACAALALALLARSVALLPHDRTKDQRQLERSDFSLLSIATAWLPPVLAVLVCGLQLTFWENAVGPNGDMLDLVLFAYLARCLLEYRLDNNERWLGKFAFGYGLSMVNNYAMIVFLPAFLVALVWIKSASFFNWRFILRMLLLGSAGLLLYFLLPAFISITDGSDLSFWQLLRAYWGMQKSSMFVGWLFRFPILVAGGASLLPVLFIGIRWPASFGDTSPTGQALTNLMTHVIHILFFAACLYVTFDFQFSPRRVDFGRHALLPFYYLGALSIGYFAGYLLLVFGAKPGPEAKTWQRPTMLRLIVNKTVVGIVWAALVGVPGALAFKNLPMIASQNGPELAKMSAITADSLPATGAVVLSDDLSRLHALRLELRRRSANREHILLESTALDKPAYHRFLARRHPGRWPSLPEDVPPGALLTGPGIMSTLLTNKFDLVYIHPSFGLYFEYFYLKPSQSVYRLVTYPTNAISAPVLTAAELKAQDDFWQGLKPELTRLIPPASERKTKKDLYEPDSIGNYARRAYSRALNHFGVAAQRAGDLKLAAKYFEFALQLNEENPVAFVNREFNSRFQAGNVESQPPTKKAVELMAPYNRNWEAMAILNGPIDEPTATYLVAQAFDQGLLFRQASQELERNLFFQPTNVATRLNLIFELLQFGPLLDRALELIADLRVRPPVPLTVEDELELIRAEAYAWLNKGDLARTEKILLEAQKKYPRENNPFNTLFDIYAYLEQFDKATKVAEEWLKVQPDSFNALVDLAAMKIRTGQHEAALPYLDRALKIRPNDPTALLNRAIVHLNAAQFVIEKLDPARLDAALADYRTVESLLPNYYHVYYGLGECYRLKGAKQEAIRYYKKYLETAPRGTPQRRIIERRIRELESGGN
jgi:tetratricopeptide (TPR) repeat protein